MANQGDSNALTDHRRAVIKTAALATTALITAPYVRGAHAAGKLSIGFWITGFRAPTARPQRSSKNGPRRKRSPSRSITSRHKARRT